MKKSKKEPSNEKVVTKPKEVQPNLDKIVNSEFDITINDMLGYVSREQVGLAELVNKVFYKDRIAAELWEDTKPDFYVFNGVTWSSDIHGEHLCFSNLITEMLERSIAELSKDRKNFKDEIAVLKHGVKAVNRKSSVEAIAELAAYGQNGCGVPTEKWDNYEMELTTPNGIVDLRTGKLRDSLPEDYRRLCTKTEYIDTDEVGEPVVFLAMLKDIFSVIGMPKKDDPIDGYVETMRNYNEILEDEMSKGKEIDLYDDKLMKEIGLE